MEKEQVVAYLDFYLVLHTYLDDLKLFSVDSKILPLACVNGDPTATSLKLAIEGTVAENKAKNQRVVSSFIVSAIRLGG